MDLSVLVIPLIALAVYVLGSLLGGKNEPPAARQRPRPLDREAGPDRPPRRQTDLERFLEEVQRRRDQAQQRAKEPAAEEFSASAERPRTPTPPVRKPAPSAPRPPRSVPASQAKPSVRRKSAAQDIPVVIALEEPRPLVEVRPAVPPSPAKVENAPSAISVLSPVQPALPAIAQAGLTLLNATAAVPRSERVRQVVSLLRTPQNLHVAVMLREILEPPVSLRRRGHGRG